MKTPPHPGRLVKDDLEALGLSTAKAAGALGVTRQTLHRLVTCESAVSPEMAVRLEMALGGSAEFWLRMQAAHDAAQARLSVPKIRRLSTTKAA